MKATSRNWSHRGCVRSALTLVEATISIVIVGVMLVAALNTVGASQTTRKKTADRQRGMPLAQDLMYEILEQCYEDPDLGPGSFGVGTDKVGDGSRALWEDVDDYDGWWACPPERKDGTKLSGFEGWARSVAVKWVGPEDLSQTAAADTGVKRITVSVTYNDTLVASLVAIRTNTWPDLGEQYLGGDVGDGGGAAANNSPIAVASALPEQGLAPLVVTLRATGSSDPDGDPLTYEWDFGDGETGSGASTTHTYSAGTYIATLTVSDGRGGTGIDMVSIKANSIITLK